MHVAFVVPRFYPYRGGYENHSLSVARHLRDMGNVVSVFTTTALDLEAFWLDGFRTLPAGHERYEGIEIFRFPISYRRWRRRAGRILGFFPNWHLKARFSRPGFHVNGLERELEKACPDVIHVGPLPYNSLMYTGIAVARRLNIPALSTPCTHFGEEGNDEISKHYVRGFQIEILNSCKNVLTLTKTEAEQLGDLGVRREKLVFSGAGIEPSDVTGGDPAHIRNKYGIYEPIVLHLGMKAPDKGSICVVEAMKMLWQDGARAHLVLAGPSLSSFDMYLSQQTLHQDRLLSLGAFDDQEKRDLLAAADVVVQPSRVESLGLVVLEAWANQKPVIAADTPVARELVEPEHDGFLVKFGDPPALASAIAKLLSDSEISATMGFRGKEKVSRKFLAENVMQGIVPLFSTGTH